MATYALGSNFTVIINLVLGVDNPIFQIFSEQLMHLCKLSKPVAYGDWEDPGKCRYCEKNDYAIHCFKVNKCVYWNELMDVIDKGRLLSLCDDCAFNGASKTLHIDSTFIGNGCVKFNYKKIVPMIFCDALLKDRGRHCWCNLCALCTLRYKLFIINDDTICSCVESIKTLVENLKVMFMIVAELPLNKDINNIIFELINDLM